MGLRAMFFLLAGIIDKFYLLQKGLSVILFFIGAKMLLDIWHIEVNVYLSFTVIIVTLTLSIVFSVLIGNLGRDFVGKQILWEDFQKDRQ
jgi:tellurite resistance protein TerC